jgi:dTDP-3-amino-3,4,6-trideoxy-alpha-D-glucose transaminase
VNSRLDELQAAILRARLPRLPAWTERRRCLADRLARMLRGTPATPLPVFDPGHVFHLFVVRSPERDQLQAHLRARGIETLIHYPVPMTRQAAFAAVAPAACPVADRTCAGVLSLPFYPDLQDDHIDAVVEGIRSFTG